MIDLLRLLVIRKGIQDIKYIVVDDRGMGEMDAKQIESDMEWLVDMIKKQQAEIDSLSMAHDDMHRLLPKDKHSLIKNLIARNREVSKLRNVIRQDSERVQELEEVNENLGYLVGKMHGESSFDIKKLMEENKRYREAIEETLQAMGMVDRQKYGKTLERALEGEIPKAKSLKDLTEEERHEFSKKLSTWFD